MAVDVRTLSDRYQRLCMILSALAASDLAMAEIANIIVRQGMAGLNASGAGIGFRHGDRLYRVAAVGSTAASLRRMAGPEAGLGLDERNPSCVVVRTGEEVWIADRDAGLARFPHLAAASPLSQGWVVLPLNHRGRTFGAFSLSFVTPPVHEPAEREFIRALGGLAALALFPFFEASESMDPTRPDPLAWGLVKATDGVVVVDGHGTIVHCNGRLCDLLGYEAVQLLGRPVEVLLPYRRREEHVGQRLGYVEDPMPRSVGSGLDLVALRSDGTELPVDVTLNPCATPDGLRTVAVVRARAGG